MLRILHGWGIDIKVESENVSEYEVLRRMYQDRERAGFMPYTHSCLRCDRLMHFSRKWYRENLRLLSLRLYDGQCGSCFKCRVITLARILWDPKLRSAPREELQEYVSRTEEWRKKLSRKLRGSRNFVNDPGFLRLIKEAHECLQNPAPQKAGF